MRAGSLVFAGTLISACAAFAAEPMAPNDIQATFFNGKPFTASTTSGTQFKMIFTPDGKMTREPRGKSGKKNSALGNLTPKVFARLGSGPRLIATPSSRAARISGRFKKVQPRLPCGPNSFQYVAAVDRHCNDLARYAGLRSKRSCVHSSIILAVCQPPPDESRGRLRHQR